jgi:hypothetical protein
MALSETACRIIAKPNEKADFQFDMITQNMYAT